MAPACSKDMSASPREQWTYEERLNEAGWFVVLPALAAVMLAAAAAVVVTGASRGAVPAVMISAVVVTIYAFRALARNVVVIDRRSGMVRTEIVGVLRCRRTIRAINEFDRVAVWERRTPVDAGYFASLYSIVLLGGKGPLQLLTTDDEKEATSVRDEVAAFLCFK